MTPLSENALFPLGTIVVLLTVAALAIAHTAGVGFADLLQAAIATLGLAAAAAVALDKLRIASAADIPTDTPSDERRAAVAAQLEANGISEETDAALFVLDQSKASYEAVVATGTAIEAKASTLLTTVAGAAGLLTVLGRLDVRMSRSTGTPFLWLAMIAAVVTVACCLYVLRTKIRPFPSAAAYVRANTVWDADSRFPIALQLAEAYNSDIIAIRRDRRFEGPAYYAAQIFLSLAALALLTHFAISLNAA